MTQAPGPHLSPDDVENWLSGTLDAVRTRHLDLCPECFDRAQLEREIVEQLATLPPMAPAPGFADRVMASVTVRQRRFTTRKSLAMAASLALVLIGSMAASIAWTLANREVLASIGTWAVAQGTQAGWLAVRAVASNFFEQPWYESLRSLAEHPGRLGLATGGAVLAYMSGVLALRRLLALPTQQVAHAS